MKSLIIILIFFSNLFQSNQKQHKPESSSSKNKSKFSNLDSLNKYIGKNKMYEYKNHRFYVGKANNTDFGLVEYNDTSFIVYQKQNKKWIITDTLNYYLFYISSAKDLNGDSFKDIVITYNATGMGGNGENVCLLYNPKTKLFYHNKYYDLPNIGYNPKNHLVTSPWWSGVRHCQEKKAYKITGDSLTFYMGVYICGEEAYEGKPGLYYYKIENGKQVIIKKRKGNYNILWTKFEKALWNSKNEF